jgi:hypothetical protein
MCCLLNICVKLFASEVGVNHSPFPLNKEERHQVFLLKKRIMDRVLAEARIDENREIRVSPF